MAAIPESCLGVHLKTDVVELFHGKPARARNDPPTFTCKGPIANRTIVIFNEMNNRRDRGVLGVARPHGRRSFILEDVRTLSRAELRQIDLNVIK